MSAITKKHVDQATAFEAVAKTLSHPLRGLILEAVDQTAARSPSELAEDLGEPLGNVSYHTRQLAQRRMLRLSRTTPRRGAIEHYYTITPAGKAALRLLRQLGEET